jgi:hypothetical protein
MAERFNVMPKYVFTSTLSSADEWSNSELVTYGELAALREQLDLLSTGAGRSPATCCATGSSTSCTST